MKTTKTILTTAIGVALAALGPALWGCSTETDEALNGTWVGEEIGYDSGLWTFELGDGTADVHAFMSGVELEVYIGTYSTRSGTGLPRVDFQIDQSDIPSYAGETAHCVYDALADQLSLACFEPGESGYPDSLAPGGGARAFLLYRVVEGGDDDDDVIGDDDDDVVGDDDTVGDDDDDVAGDDDDMVGDDDDVVGDDDDVVGDDDDVVGDDDDSEPCCTDCTSPAYVVTEFTIETFLESDIYDQFLESLLEDALPPTGDGLILLFDPDQPQTGASTFDGRFGAGEEDHDLYSFDNSGNDVTWSYDQDANRNFVSTGSGNQFPLVISMELTLHDAAIAGQFDASYSTVEDGTITGALLESDALSVKMKLGTLHEMMDGRALDCDVDGDGTMDAWSVEFGFTAAQFF